MSHKKSYSKGSNQRDSTWTEQVEQSQRVLGVAKTPQDDQHDVYTTGVGSVVGSGSTAPPKQLPIRSPDSSTKKPKKLKMSTESSTDFGTYFDEFLVK